MVPIFSPYPFVWGKGGRERERRREKGGEKGWETGKAGAVRSKYCFIYGETELP
jgi:hypothetical protein